MRLAIAILAGSAFKSLSVSGGAGGFTLGIFSNRLVLAGIASELLLAAFFIYTPLGNSLFTSAPVSAFVWLLLIPFAVLLLALDETRKYVVRRRTDNSLAPHCLS